MTTLLSRHRQHVPEALTAAALLAGWALVTWGVAWLTAPAVWPLSAGLLCLSLAGWRLLWTIARDGLMYLSSQRPD